MWEASAESKRIFVKKSEFNVAQRTCGLIKCGRFRLIGAENIDAVILRILIGAGIWKKIIIDRKDLPMTKVKLLSWLVPWAFCLALLAPQSAFSQGCG